MIQIHWRPSANELRFFAVGQILFLAVLATSLFNRGYSFPFTAGIAVVSTIIGLIGLIKPAWIRWLYLTWVIAVFPIGWCVSLLLLAAVFGLILIPLSLVLKCLKIDPLSRKFEPNQTSYWTKRRSMPAASRYFRPF